MATLTLPIPQWEASQIPDKRVVIESPIELKLGRVLLPDGSEFRDINLGIAAFFIYRHLATGVTEVWNEDTRNWEPDPGAAVAALKPGLFVLKVGDPFPWQATVVALGQTTAADQDKFEVASPPSFQYPRYSFRAYFETAGDNGAKISGLSGATAPIRFLGSEDSFLVGLRPDKKPEQAEQIEVFIKDIDRRVIGKIELRRVGATARITVARLNAAGGLTAQVVLREDGNIVLNCPGKVIIQAPELETEKIRYQPNAGGPKQYL
jgi:hypothetical protein